MYKNYIDNPVGLTQLKYVTDDICKSSVIYHMDEISLPAFIVQTDESRNYITQYISNRFIETKVYYPRSVSHSIVFDLEDTSDKTIGNLMQYIDKQALGNQPEGICIGIRFSQSAAVNIKDKNLARFMHILAGYKKVCWVFYFENSNRYNIANVFSVIKEHFVDVNMIYSHSYTPQELAQVVATKLESINIVFAHREKALCALEAVLADVYTINAALAIVPEVLKKALYNGKNLVVSDKIIHSVKGGKHSEQILYSK